MNKSRIIKNVEINGVRLNIEVSKENASRIPEKMESRIRIRSKNLEKVSANSIFF